MNPLFEIWQCLLNENTLTSCSSRTEDWEGIAIEDKSVLDDRKNCTNQIYKGIITDENNHSW